MKIAVCDDEKEIRNSIERKIRLVYSDADVTQYENGQALLDAREQFDIIFLDIQMNGINGMDTARLMRKAGNDATLIFVTAIEEYVFQAFDVGAFHYLVKPIEQVKFFEILCHAVESRKESRQKQISARALEEKSITIKTGAVTEKVYLGDILYIEVFNRKVIVYKADDKLEFYGKLVDLERNLGDVFVRSHRAYLVNMKYVLKYDATSITLENGTTIMMAKQKYGEFVKKYMKYASGIQKW